MAPYASEVHAAHREQVATIWGEYDAAVARAKLARDTAMEHEYAVWDARLKAIEDERVADILAGQGV